MKKIILAAAAATLLTASSAYAAAEVHIPKEQWSFNGVLGTFDRAQLQRGFQVYKDVCAACHSLRYISFRNFEALGYSEADVPDLAEGAFAQQRPLVMAPRSVSRLDLESMYRDAMRYW